MIVYVHDVVAKEVSRSGETRSPYRAYILVRLLHAGFRSPTPHFGIPTTCFSKRGVEESYNKGMFKRMGIDKQNPGLLETFTRDLLAEYNYIVIYPTPRSILSRACAGITYRGTENKESGCRNGGSGN